MKSLKPFWLSPVERFLACVLLLVFLPMLFFVTSLIHLTAGSPVIVADELRTIDGPVTHRHRFRTTGRATASFFPIIGRFLRTYSIDEFPGLWSVARGNMKLRNLLRFR
jgi:lipopolysaccharide/colanic/teichoic acid biosynthesis glycosyltransferase